MVGLQTMAVKVWESLFSSSSYYNDVGGLIMNEEFKSFRKWELIKRIATILFWMYVIVVVRSPETNLPTPNDFLDFYRHLFEVLSEL